MHILSIANLKGDMMEKQNIDSTQTTETKQVFLANAISDISSYIKFSDTKISIILATMMALVAAVASCCEPLLKVVSNINPCSWTAVTITILGILFLISFVSVFIFGILTIRGHSSNIKYQSKWFISQTIQEYPFDAYKKDILEMTDKQVIENMAAELYKLNDINQQKLKSSRLVICFFALSLITATIICVLIAASTL